MRQYSFMQKFDIASFFLKKFLATIFLSIHNFVQANAGPA